MSTVRESVMRAFQHRDFRLLWWGAFFSFVGSWLQNAGERWLVGFMTNQDAFKLAFVSFCGSAPVAVVGPFAGTLADAFDKKTVLNIAQILFGSGAILLGIMCWINRVQYWQIVSVALLFGFVGSFEGPTRQSVVSRVVPPEDLAQAVPLNAMTFNVARLVGPAFAATLLGIFDPMFGIKGGSGLCYILNGISYLALIYAVLAIRANLKPSGREAMPVGDLIVEGMKYTFRDARFRTLFYMEAISSSCGMFYLAVMPKFVVDTLGMQEAGYGAAYVMVAIGAIGGILLMTVLADRPFKSLMVRSGMFGMGVGVFLLAFARSAWIAFPLFALIGCSVLVQFNTTNTLFQLLSPDRLRGRVLAMHQWAVGGIGPFGTLFFGWFADASEHKEVLHFNGSTLAVPQGGMPLAFEVGGTCILLGAIWGAWRIRALASHSWELVNLSS